MLIIFDKFGLLFLVYDTKCVKIIFSADFVDWLFLFGHVAIYSNKTFFDLLRIIFQSSVVKSCMICQDYWAMIIVENQLKDFS